MLGAYSLACYNTRPDPCDPLLTPCDPLTPCKWRERTIGTDRWKTTERMITGMASAPGYRSCYWMLRGGLDAEFVRLLDKIIDDSGPATSFALEAEWRSGVGRALGADIEKKT